MKCKLCFRDKKLINAHIIPRSFFDLTADSAEPNKLIFSTPGVFPKRSPKGVYDREILCAECEAAFSKCDDYGFRFLVRGFDTAQPIMRNGVAFAYNLGRCDYNSLMMFFLSIIWRAHHSSHAMFSEVNLGPYEPKIKRIILDRDVTKDPHYSVALTKFDLDADAVGILSPDRTEYDGVNHYRVYLGGYMAALKISNLPGSELFRQIYVDSGKDVIAIVRELGKSKEFPLMLKMIRQSLE